MFPLLLSFLSFYSPVFCFTYIGRVSGEKGGRFRFYGMGRPKEVWEHPSCINIIIIFGTTKLPCVGVLCIRSFGLGFVFEFSVRWGCDIIVVSGYY